MTNIFTNHYGPLWAVALALALFVPVRHLIWILYVRRAQRSGGDAADQVRLKKRAGLTAALVCLVFSYFYISYLFRGAP